MISLLQGTGRPKTQRVKVPAETQLLPETVWANDSLPSGTPPQNCVVVTISRQFGSGGADIGLLVAKASGLEYLDNEIIAEVAKRLGVEEQHAARQDEQTAGMAGHILEAIQASHPFTVHFHPLLNPAAPAQAKELAYLRLTQKVILELATRGNAVIIGRGAQFLLHHAPRTLHIYIFAPLPYRIENVMKQFQLNHSQAQELIAQRDYEQDSYLRRYYGNDGHQPGLYHLLINTSLFPFDLAADFVRQALPLITEIDGRPQSA